MTGRFEEGRPEETPLQTLRRIDRNLREINVVLNGDPNYDTLGVRARLRGLEQDLKPCIEFFKDEKKTAELNALLEIRKQFKTATRWFAAGLLLNLAGLGAVALAILRSLGAIP